MACTSSVLPAVEFDECAPEFQLAQVTAIYYTRNTSADVFTNVTDPDEWADRLDNTGAAGVGAAPIRKLTVIGSLGEPGQTETKMSGGRKTYSSPEYTLAFRVDEFNDDNIAAARTFQQNPGVTFKVWFKAANRIWGGNAGQVMSIKQNPIIPESDTDYANITGSLSWTGPIPTASAIPAGV